MKYTNSYCWVTNTYYLPFNEEIPFQYEEDKRDMIPYYQWIWIILWGQAFFFPLPSIVWHGLNQRAGLDADNVIIAAHTFSKVSDSKSKRATLTIISNQLDRFLDLRLPLNKGNCAWSSRMYFIQFDFFFI